jgi:CDP-diacylglycerol---glycerol-3-phosphate 3-phosphatidyltransferase
VSNLLSLSRALFAGLFFIPSTGLRIFLLFAVMVTDYLDGFLARRSGRTTQVGAVLDPIMDKLFVLIALGLLISEGDLRLWEGLAMISRDFFLVVYGLYIAMAGKWHTLHFRSLWWGKFTSLGQYFVLVVLVLQFELWAGIYVGFLLLGLLYLAELFLFKKSRVQNS